MSSASREDRHVASSKGETASTLAAELLLAEPRAIPSTS
jgi:hypothetical protein